MIKKRMGRSENNFAFIESLLANLSILKLIFTRSLKMKNERKRNKRRYNNRKTPLEEIIPILKTVYVKLSIINKMVAAEITAGKIKKYAGRPFRLNNFVNVKAIQIPKKMMPVRKENPKIRIENLSPKDSSVIKDGFEIRNIHSKVRYTRMDIAKENENPSQDIRDLNTNSINWVFFSQVINLSENGLNISKNLLISLLKREFLFSAK